MIRCIIVEDELLAQQVIQSHLKQFDQLELVATCSNAQEAKEVLAREEIDLIFLDIQLPGMTGFHFLSSFMNPPLVIITTAYSEYALESYEFNVLDYLLKPISFERFNKAIQKIMNGRLVNPNPGEKEVRGDHFFIKSGSKFFKVNFAEIIYVQSLRDYVRIHTRTLKLVTHQTLGEIERSLPSNQFIRIHKSYIVAIDFIQSIYGNTIEIDSTTLPIGNLYKNNVMQLIGKKQ
ncbi:MAG: DNA-binding response regulator [Bacteroidetes bacterium]|nr:MAG: DNA-binding response regulator [Bacteroidota bacterium]